MRLGHDATTAQIDPVWRALVAANRNELPHPSNPSLLYVGTVLTIPP
jgi:nucleoid-associated protein YgaU